MKLKRWTVNAYTDTETGEVRIGHRSNQGAYWTRWGAVRAAIGLDAAQAAADTIFDPGWLWYRVEKR